MLRKIKFLLLFASVVFVFEHSVFAQKPNILLIISDDLNTRIGPYMNLEEYTPNLDRLAQQGIKFNRAYSQYPLCGPSRASFMSGLYPETNGVLTNQHRKGSYRASNEKLSNHPSLAGFFREQGYFTARVSKIFHMGVPGGIERGENGDDDPDSWDYFYNVMGPETLSDGEREWLSPYNKHLGSSFLNIKLENGSETTQTDYLATSQAIAILESRAKQVLEGATNLKKLKEESPFFLAVGLVRPHVPFVAPEHCFDAYPFSDQKLPEVKIGEDVPEAALRQRNENIWRMTKEQQAKAISGYMASVKFMDEQVGRLLNSLDRLNLRNNTIVVFISDHGYNLGQHNCWSKVSLWEGSIRVPMIISLPGNFKTKGSVSNQIVELIDLYPTLAELAGLKRSQPKILQGTSLVPLINGEEEPIKELAYTITNRGKAASIRTPEFRYTRWGEKTNLVNEELYYHVDDPEEWTNLVNDKNFSKALELMRNKFESAQKKARLN